MTRRLLLSLIAILAIGAVTAGIVGAQEEAATPAIEIELSPTRVTLQGAAGVVVPGPTRLAFRNTGRRAPAEAAVVALKEGVTLAQFRRALPRASRGPAPLKRLASFEAGGQVAPRGTYETTVELKPDTTYVVANAASDDPAKAPLTTFRTCLLYTSPSPRDS